MWCGCECGVGVGVVELEEVVVVVVVIVEVVVVGGGGGGGGVVHGGVAAAGGMRSVHSTLCSAALCSVTPVWSCSFLSAHSITFAVDKQSGPCSA